jgi:elongation factor 3
VSLKFSFPEPGFLDGVTSKEKPIVKLTKASGWGRLPGPAGCAAAAPRASPPPSPRPPPALQITFAYPGVVKPQLKDVSVHCALGSRIAVLGANGAGKSTLIKVLCGEQRPQKGIVYKHPNLRLAYVAQHAFHHLEEHLETTPLKYLRDR